MNSPILLFFLALVNVAVFEVLYGLFHKILPEEKGAWCMYYWIATLILCCSTHTFDPSVPRALAAWAPAAFVAIIHCATSFSTCPMKFSGKHPPDDKEYENQSSFANRVNDTKNGSKEIK